MILIFVFENCQNLFSWSLPFGPFWSAKYQVLEVKAERSEFCPVRFRKQTLGKANKQVFWWVENQFCQISWSEICKISFFNFYVEISEACVLLPLKASNIRLKRNTHITQENKREWVYCGQREKRETIMI